MNTVPAHIAAIERPVESLMKYYFIKALLSLPAFPILLPVLYFRYHTMRYTFDGEGIRMSWGLLFRHEVILNYSRIQDVHLRSSFIERLLGLARIEIQTAAGASGTEMTLEGLVDHAGMRDFLYSKMRGAQRAHVQPPLLPLEPSDLGGVLNEIAVEMRAIRTLLQEQRGRD